MRVRTELGDLYVEVSGTAGSRPPIVLWHSYLHHGGMWKAQVAALAADRRVFNIDAPGHGRSTALSRPISMDDCARALFAVMDACAIERAALAGLSWGGMVAMEAALARPDRVAAIALLDTSCRAEPRRNRLKYKLLGAITANLGPAPRLLDQVERLFYCDRTLREARASIVEPWRAYVSRMDRPSIGFALECITGRRDLTAALRRLDMPALVCVGAEDRAQPPAEAEWIAQALPRAQLAIIPDAGHVSAMENPLATNALLSSFFARVT